DATLDLCGEAGVEPAAIEGVEILTPDGSGVALIHPRPTSGLAGKFSMEYCVAAALLDRRVNLDSFEDAAVLRPAAQALLRRVTVSTDGSESGPADGFADVTLVLSDGRRLSRRVDEPRGAPELPLSLEDLTAKYRDCAGRILGPATAERALDFI